MEPTFTNPSKMRKYKSEKVVRTPSSSKNKEKASKVRDILIEDLSPIHRADNFLRNDA
jgi:hypothetical protein